MDQVIPQSSSSSESDDIDYSPVSEEEYNDEEEKHNYEHIQFERFKEKLKISLIEDLQEESIETWEELNILPPEKTEPPIRKPTTPLDKSLSPIQLFNHIMSDFWGFLAQETNSYAEMKKSDPDLKRRSRMTNWSDTTEKEIMKYIGLNLYMSLYKKKNCEGNQLINLI